MIQVAKRLANGQVSEQVSISWRLASHLDSLRDLLLAHIVVSFSHIRRDDNKAADLLANAGMDGDLVHRWGPLKNFEAEDWAHHCRQVVAHNFEGGTHMARPNVAVASGDRRREHATIGLH